MLHLRSYQRECIDTINDYLRIEDTHGVVCLPTAAGKTIIFATMIHEWFSQWPETRVCILAHRYELLEQAEEKIKRIWPLAPTGIWSAGLKRKEKHSPILIAGIQSVFKNACDLDPFDIIIIDEAHLVPTNAKTMYRKFLADAALVNPHVRHIGFSATPYRLDGGELWGKGKLFRHKIYDSPIVPMIEDGYLSRLRTKATETVLDGKGVKKRGGDFIQGELEKAVNTNELVGGAVNEIIAKGKDRKCWLIFAAGVKHAYHVQEQFARCGFNFPVITGDTDQADRREILTAFDRGELQCVINVNCLTTGLDITRIDLIAVLRATLSTSLWVQMVGRGFRLHNSKADCLILDFGSNCLRHGPLDNLTIKTKGTGEGKAPVKVCPECAEYVHAAVLCCPACGFQFPEREVTHESKASTASIISKTEPWECVVEEIEVSKHQGAGKPHPVLKVTYHCGYESHTEWVCLEHPGFVGIKAAGWWERRFKTKAPETVDQALEHLFLREQLQAMTTKIKVRQVGKYTEVLKVELKDERQFANA